MSALSFYRPEFLWALFFLLVVAAIHLLHRPRTKNFDFSTLRFFRTTVVRTSRMRRLRKWLLLLARLAAAALLIALFAAPFNRHDRYGMLRDPHLTVFTWIDRTESMGYTERGATLMSKSAALIDSFMAACPSTVRRLDYDESRVDFIPHTPGSTPQWSARGGGPRLDRVLHAWNESRGNYSLPLLLLCSDYQRSTSANLDSLLRAHATGNARYLFCVVAPDKPWNFTVRKAELRDRAGAEAVEAEIATQGRPIDSGEITVSMASIRCGAKRFSLAARDSALLDLEVPAAKREGGSVTLTGADPLPFDNIRYFAAQNRAASRILVIGDSLRNYPVVAALAAASSAQRRTLATAAAETVTYDALDSADVIVINALAKPSRTLEALRQGRSFAQKIICLSLSGDEKESAQSEALLSKVLPPGTTLKPVSLTTPLSIELPDTISEVWRGFPKLTTTEAVVYRYASGLPGTVLLRLAGGAPLVTCYVDRDGRTWILFATPIGVTDANNLCETGFYVPCLDRILRSAASAGIHAADPWIAGVPRRNPFYGKGKGAAVTRSDGTAMARWLAQPMVEFEEPGVYKIAPDGADAFWIAVNPDPEESNLDYAMPKIADGAKGSVIALSDRELLEVMRHKGRAGSYIPWILLCLLLIAEVFLWERPFSYKNKSE